MSDEKARVPRLVSINREQLLLRTVDVEQLVDDDHSVRSIWELVGDGAWGTDGTFSLSFASALHHPRNLTCRTPERFDMSLAPRRPLDRLPEDVPSVPEFPRVVGERRFFNRESELASTPL